MRERSKIVDQARQHPGLLQDGVDLRFVTRIDAVEHPLESSLQHGERRPQLVGDVGHEVTTLDVLRLQLRRHAVEGARQGAHPPRAVFGRANGVIAFGHAVRRFDHVSERKPEAAHQAPEHTEEDEEPHHPQEDALRPYEPRNARAWKQPRDDGSQSDRNEKEHDREQAADASREARTVPAPRVWSAARRPRLVHRPPWRPRRASHRSHAPSPAMIPHSANL